MTQHHDELNCISHVPIFKNLPLELRRDLVHISTHQQFFKKGSLMHSPGDGRLSVMSLDSGKAKIYSLSEDGHEQVISLMQQGDINGEENLFDTENDDLFIEALEDSTACSINYSDFQKLLLKSPELALHLLNEFGRRLVTAQKNAVRRNSMEAGPRLFAALVDYADEAGSNTFTLPLKKKDLASLLGITPETLSREFTKLKKEGYITAKGKQITILKQ